MSIYKRCSQTARELMLKGLPFTELDVVNGASTQQWGEPSFKKALLHANQILSAQFRAGNLIRFGPVELGNGEKDFVRFGAKIVYADSTNGPDQLTTPNGTFFRLTAQEDDFGAVGRKRGTNRDDSAPWDELEEMKNPGQVLIEDFGQAIKELEELKSLPQQVEQIIEKRLAALER